MLDPDPGTYPNLDPEPSRYTRLHLNCCESVIGIIQLQTRILEVADYRSHLDPEPQHLREGLRPTKFYFQLDILYV